MAAAAVEMTTAAEDLEGWAVVVQAAAELRGIFEYGTTQSFGEYVEVV